MRNIYVSILLLSGFTAPLLGQSAEDIVISSEYTNRSLEEMLQDIEHQYPIDFYYNPQWLSAKKYTIQFDKIPLSEVLSALLEDTGLSYIRYSTYAIIIARENELTKTFSRDYFVAKQLNADKDQTTTDFLILGDSALSNPGEKVIISGTITDAVTAETLTGAVVYVEALNLAATADAQGVFRLSIPVGSYAAEVQLLGYETFRKNIKVLSDVPWNIRIEPEAFELEEVVVQEKADDSNIRSVQMGLTKLSPKQIEQLPAFLGEADVIKSILTLPGVSTVGEGASGFNVRGGNIDQNLIMQDEALIFNSSHVLGLFSVFNPDAIQEVTLYKGNIPAQYGGRLSSVLDVSQKDGNFETFTGKGGIGIVASRLVLEGPIIKDKTAFLIGGRSSYSDWVLNLMRNPDLQKSSAFFYDLNARISHRLNNKSSVALSWYQSYDNFRFSDQFGYSWKTYMGSLSWKQIISSLVSSSFSAVYGNIENASYDPEGNDAFTLSNGPRYYKLKQNFFFTPDKHNVNAGIEWIRYDARPESIEKRGDFSTVAPQMVDKDDGQELGIYINDEFELNHRISFSLGLRYSLYQQLGPSTVYTYEPGLPRRIENVMDSTVFSKGKIIQHYHGWEPRFSMKIGLSPSSSVKVSYNRLYQYIHLISNTTAAVPVDIWQVSTSYIPPQAADNFSIGYFKNFSNNTWETSVEVYYRNISSLVEYKDLPDLLLNPHIETELLTGIGKAYGGELSVVRNTGRWTGQLAYTYSRTFSKVTGKSVEETINKGEWFPSNFDKPHNMNLALNCDINSTNRLALNFTYSTGRPITAPVANYFLGSTVVPHYSERNQFRIPDYHRLDFSYTLLSKRVKRSKYKSSFTFTLYNVYGRKNAFSVFFKRDLNSTANAYKLSILGSTFPAITYNFEF